MKKHSSYSWRLSLKSQMVKQSLRIVDLRIVYLNHNPQRWTLMVVARTSTLVSMETGDVWLWTFQTYYQMRKRFLLSCLALFAFFPLVDSLKMEKTLRERKRRTNMRTLLLSDWNCWSQSDCETGEQMRLKGQRKMTAFKYNRSKGERLDKEV